MATTEVEGVNLALVRYSANDVYQISADFIEITGDCDTINPLIIDGLKLFGALEIFTFLNFTDAMPKIYTANVSLDGIKKLVLNADLEHARLLLDDPEFVSCSSEGPCLLLTAMVDLEDELNKEREKGVVIEGEAFSNFVCTFFITYFLKEQRIAG